VTLAYRRVGPDAGTPLLFLQHFRGNMDNWDPQVVDGLAAHRPVILVDNRGVSRSSGSTSNNVAAMGRDILAVIDALGETHIDLLGFSLGGMVAQQILLDRPSLVRRAVLVGTGAPGAVDMMNDEITAVATTFPAILGGSCSSSSSPRRRARTPAFAICSECLRAWTASHRPARISCTPNSKRCARGEGWVKLLQEPFVLSSVSRTETSVREHEHERIVYLQLRERAAHAAMV